MRNVGHCASLSGKQKNYSSKSTDSQLELPVSWSLLAERRDGWSLMTRMFRALGARPIRLTTAVGLSSPSMNPTPLYERRDYEASLAKIERIVILGNEPRPDAAILRSRTGLPHPVNREQRG